jgi:hypothetical protein
MTETWPIDLPQSFEVGGYSEGVADNLFETQPDTGPPIRRRRSTSAPRPLGGSMVLTESQLGVFRNFFDVTLLSGAIPFNFPQQISPAIDILVTFTKNSLPTWRPIGGGYWRLNLSLLVLP